MKKSILFGSPFLAVMALASSAGATTWFVSPTGTATSGCPTRDVPACDLGAAASAAVAGDTVILTDGVYKRGIWVMNSGTADAWITFQADECSMPIIEGPGVGPMDDNQDTGVGSNTAQYIRFIGLVSRGWNTGFGNGWTGNVAQDSNGHWEIINCIGDWNGRTGFTFFSATDFHVKNSISAHNGSSVVHSWSSGMTLYSSTGKNLIEGNVSFENMDAEQHTDGSGFIVDEGSNNASFINNIAFRNGGSCLRLTRSSGTKFINNTCYHNSLDTLDQGPTNPGELYFTNASDNSTVTNTQFVNNVLVNTGTGPGAEAVLNQPTTGWSNNVIKTGTATYFAGAETDYTLAAGATDLIGKGTTTGAPTTDIGFDPKCIVKADPMPIGTMAKGSWWQHSIDYAYIKSIGGVASCFNPKMRAAGSAPDVGAYANGAVTKKAPGNCTTPPPPPPPVSAGGTGGADPGAGGMSAGGTVSAGGMMTNPMAGAPATGGTGVANGGTAGAPASGGVPNAAGGTGGTGVTGATGGTGTPAAGSGTVGTGGTGTGAGGASVTGASGGMPAAGSSSSDAGDEKSGCGCRVAGDAPRGSLLAAFGGLGLALLGLRRRRASR
jgi:MYXO-CTERM domain-containing protein